MRSCAHKSSLIDADALLLGSADDNIFGNMVDCTEQALLNAYFDGSEAGRSVQHFAHTPPGGPRRKGSARL